MTAKLLYPVRVALRVYQAQRYVTWPALRDLVLKEVRLAGMPSIEKPCLKQAAERFQQLGRLFTPRDQRWLEARGCAPWPTTKED